MDGCRCGRRLVELARPRRGLHMRECYGGLAGAHSFGVMNRRAIEVQVVARTVLHCATKQMQIEACASAGGCQASAKLRKIFESTKISRR